MSQIRIPQYTRQGVTQRAAVNPGAAATETERTGIWSLAKPLAGVIAHVGAIEAKQAAAEEASLYAEVKTEAMKRTLELQETLATDTGYATHRERFATGIAEINDWADGMFKKHPEMRESFKRDYGLFAMQKDFAVRRDAIRGLNEQHVAALDRRCREAASAYSLDTASNEIVLDSVLRDIDALEQSGAISPTDAENRRVAAKRDAAMKRREVLRATDPEAALAESRKYIAKSGGPGGKTGEPGEPGGPGDGAPSTPGEPGDGAESDGLTAQDWEMEHRKDAAASSRRKTANEHKATVINGTLSSNMAYALETGDFSKLEQAENGLRSLGRAAEADRIGKIREVYESAYPLLRDIKMESFADQEKRIEDVFDRSGILRPDNADIVLQVREAAEKALEKRQQEFLADPAGYVAQFTFGENEDENTPAGVEARANASMALQSEMAKGISNFTPQPMSAAQAQEVRSMLDDKDLLVNKKMTNLLKMEAAYGSLAPQVLKQIGANSGVIAAMRYAKYDDSDAQYTGRMMLRAALMRDGEVPKRDDAPMLRMLADNSEYMQYWKKQRDAFPENAALAARVGEIEDTVYRMVEHFGKDALKGLDVPYDFRISVRDGLFLRMPKKSEVSIGIVAEGLRVIRDNIGDHLPKLTEKAKSVYTQTGRWRTVGSRAELYVNGDRVLVVPMRQITRAFAEGKERREEKMREYNESKDSDNNVFPHGDE